MKKRIAINLFLSALLSLASYGFIDTTGSFEKIGRGILEPEIQALAIYQQNPNIVFAGTSKGIYKSANAGRDFSFIFQVPGSEGGVNHLYAAEGQGGGLYAATDSGLFVSRDEGRHFENIFSSGNENSRRCLWVAVDDGSVYVGTQGGLYYRPIENRDWKKGSGMFANTAVNFIYSNGNYFYLATENEVYRLGKNGDGIKKVFSLVSREGGEQEPLSDSPPEDEAGGKGQISFLAEGVNDRKLLCLATGKGIFLSGDCGDSWQRVDSDGLPLEEATSLVAFDRRELLVGTKKGLFGYADGRWAQLYKGLETNAINFIAESGGGIYVATEKGIYALFQRTGTFEGSLPDLNILKKQFEGEPRIIEVQRMAVDYAETSPDKISGWRKAAQKRAWLPTFSIGLDQAKNKTIGDSIYGTSSGGGFAFTGPHDKTFYNNFGWDVSVSWDLGDLVWNPDQTSIDSRSKLMVELREDVLDQVTRLYFERRRLQMEMASNPGLAGQELLDKEMRIEELTALLDGFTGGKFSQAIKYERAVSSQPSDVSQN